MLSKHLLKRALFPGKAPIKLGRFTVLSVLGEGGMGVVYACYDDQLERKVAVKVLRSKRMENHGNAQARLLREAQAMARLSHPNIAMVHEVGTVDEQMYMAMEFVRGVSLDAWIEKEPRPWRVILDAFIQAGRGLAAAHRAGLIHRDFKPQNAMITEDGIVKVLDFGLSRATGVVIEDLLESVPDTSGESLPAPLIRSLTRTGTLVGTPAYMSPEQHAGEKATAASDQFSFCVSLYRALYGQFPFSITSLEALRRDIQEGKVAPVPLVASVPLRVLKTLRRGMAVDPKARFPSMGELLAELSRDPEVTRRRAAVLVAVAGSVGIASFSAASAYAPNIDVCPDARAELVGIWDPDRAEAVRTTILATGGPHAAETWAILAPQLDRYATAWAAMRNEACRTHAEERQSDNLFDLRTACLDQRRAGFAGIVDALAALDAGTLDKAAPAVGRLPSMAPCADAEALTAAIPPPEEPAARARVQSLREALARAHAQENAGQYREGLAAVEKIRAEAAELGYTPLLAESWLRQGSLQMEVGEPVAADRSLDEALRTALSVGYMPVAAQAISKRTFVRAVRLGQRAQALAELPLAEALNINVKSDVDLYSEFLNNSGAVHRLAGSLPKARQSLEAALALRERHGQQDTLLSMAILGNLNMLAAHEGDDVAWETSARQLVEMSGRILGEHHPWHLKDMINSAEALLKTGRPGEARALLLRAEQALMNSESGLLRGWALVVLGDLASGEFEYEERDLAAARRYYQAAVDERSADSSIVRYARIGLASVAAQEGDEAAMRAQFSAILAQATPQTDAQNVDRLVNAWKFGQALLDLGRTQDAVEHLNGVMPDCAKADLSPEEAVCCLWSRYHLGRAYQQLGDFAAAEGAFTQALDDGQHFFAENNLRLLAVRRALGENASSQGRFDEAVSRLREVEATYASLVEADYAPLARTRFALARALTGDLPTMPADAASLAGQALAVLKAKGSGFANEAQAVEAFLASHSTSEP